MALLAYGAMAAIFALRYQRNLLAESWALFTRSAHVATVFEPAQGGDDASLRKCTVAGRVLYSNVACTATNPTTHALDLAKNRGFIAPKAPPVATPEIPSATERGMQRALAGQ